MPPRYWHVGLCAIAATAIFTLVDNIYLHRSGSLPDLKQIWEFALAVPLLCGSAVTLGAGGAGIWQRILGAAACGVAAGVLSIIIPGAIGAGNFVGVSEMAINSIWRAFIFSIVSIVGVLLTEINLPAPDAGARKAEDRGQEIRRAEAQKIRKSDGRGLKR
jgi:Na+-driven multidrug efflux pump